MSQRALAGEPSCIQPGRLVVIGSGAGQFMSEVVRRPGRGGHSKPGAD